MINQNEIMQFLRDNRADLMREYNLAKIGLLGSFARNEPNENSDIDILVEFRPGTQNLHDTKTRLKQMLQACFQRDIELCREKYIKPHIREYIEKEVIYA